MTDLLRVGFTGTQNGMNTAQRARFVAELHALHFGREVEFHHGDCIGADADAHDLVRALDPGIRIVLHPPAITTKRAWKQGDDVLPAKPYLDRNRDIVDACEVLIACPKETEETLRSGTWATIRYARAVGKPRVLLIPE